MDLDIIDVIRFFYVIIKIGHLGSVVKHLFVKRIVVGLITTVGKFNIFIYFTIIVSAIYNAALNTDTLLYIICSELIRKNWVSSFNK